MNRQELNNEIEKNIKLVDELMAERNEIIRKQDAELMRLGIYCD